MSDITIRPKLEVCLSPALLHLYDVSHTIVVIIDIFRATSTIAAALDNGAKAIMPVATVEECLQKGKEIYNSITAGERDGHIAPGLQHGNSPLEYTKDFIQGKILILTTTNGTRLLHMVNRPHVTIITGSFLNLSAVCSFLLAQNQNVLLACASWKDRFNLEDSLFAGAVAEKIAHAFSISCDSTHAVMHLHKASEGKYLEFLKNSTHYARLSAYGLWEDMNYCTTPDTHPVVPILKGEYLVI